MVVAAKDKELFEERKANISKLPSLKYLKLSEGTLHLAISETASEIKFRGENGSVIKAIERSETADCLIKRVIHIFELK